MSSYDPLPRRAQHKHNDIAAPLPLPLDRYPLEGSPAAVTSGGVWLALQDLTQAYGEVLGDPANLRTTDKGSIVGAINEVFDKTVLLQLATKAITGVLGAPLSVGPTSLWLGGNCVSGDTSVQVIANSVSNPQLLTGVFTGVYSAYVLPNGWEDVTVSISGQPALKFYQDARLKKLDQAYIKPVNGIPASDLSYAVVQRLAPQGGLAGQVLTQTTGQVAQWQTLPAFLLRVSPLVTNSVQLIGRGTASDPLRATVLVSQQADNQVVALADGLYVHPSSLEVTSKATSSVEFSGAGSVLSPLSADVQVSTDELNQLEIHEDGLYVPPPPTADGIVRYDEAQGLSSAEQEQARANIDATGSEQLAEVTQDISGLSVSLGNTNSTVSLIAAAASAAQTAANGAQTTANTGVANAAVAQATADSAVMELSNKVTRRSGTGTFAYSYSGNPGADLGTELSHLYKANAIPRYNTAGTLTASMPTQLNEVAPKQYVDNAIQSANAAQYLGAYFYGKTTSAYTPPAPTNAVENYFDFTTNTPYAAAPDLSGWVAGSVVTPSVNGVAIGITSQFWDLAEDAGVAGTARWNSARTDWDYFPTKYTTAEFDNVSVGPNASGELSVKISADADNALSLHADGLFAIDLVGAGGGNSNLPEAPAEQSNSVLVVDSSGAVLWSAMPLTALQTAASNAQTSANAAQADATQALANVAVADSKATAAQISANAAQADATQALTNAATADSKAAAAQSALSTKLNIRTVPVGESYAYVVQASTQNLFHVSVNADGSSIPFRKAAGQISCAPPVTADDAVCLQHFNASQSSQNTAISAASGKADTAILEAGIANTAVEALDTRVDAVEAAQAEVKTKVFVSDVSAGTATATTAPLTFSKQTVGGVAQAAQTVQLPLATAATAGLMSSAAHQQSVANTEAIQAIEEEVVVTGVSVGATTAASVPLVIQKQTVGGEVQGSSSVQLPVASATSAGIMTAGMVTAMGSFLGYPDFNLENATPLEITIQPAPNPASASVPVDGWLFIQFGTTLATLEAAVICNGTRVFHAIQRGSGEKQTTCLVPVKAGDALQLANTSSGWSSTFASAPCILGFR